MSVKTSWVQIIDVKKSFTFLLLFLLKNAFLRFFIFRNVFFIVATLFHPTKPANILLNLLNSRIKRLLSDGFNMTAIKNSLMKSRSPQTLSCVLGQYIYWELFIWFD